MTVEELVKSTNEIIDASAELAKLILQTSINNGRFKMDFEKESKNDYTAAKQLTNALFEMTIIFDRYDLKKESKYRQNKAAKLKKSIRL